MTHCTSAGHACEVTALHLADFYMHVHVCDMMSNMQHSQFHDVVTALPVILKEFEDHCGLGLLAWMLKAALTRD